MTIWPTIITIGLAIIAICFLLTVFFGAPYVPTRRQWAKSCLDLAGVTPKDTVIDLGSGDGIILKLAAERGAHVTGYEINPFLVVISKFRLRHHSNTQVKLTNFWRTKLPANTTVVYVFSTTRDLAKLSQYFQGQAKHIKTPKLRVITFGFTLPELTFVKQNQSAYLYELPGRIIKKRGTNQK